MRCSLLTLSSYIDDELEPARLGELEAHLVGCTRCSTALGYLREESAHLAGLARVRISDGAAQQLFTELALIDIDEMLPPSPPRRDDPGPDVGTLPPWLGDTPGKALPWASSRPQAAAPSTPPYSEPRAATAVAVHPDQMEITVQPTAHFEVSGARIPGVAITPPAPPQPATLSTPPLPTPPIQATPPALPPVMRPPTPAVPLPPRQARRVMPEPVRRAIDAVAVRFALMRRTDSDDDDSVEIVADGFAAPQPQPPVRRAMPPRVASIEMPSQQAAPRDKPIETPVHTVIEPPARPRPMLPDQAEAETLLPRTAPHPFERPQAPPPHPDDRGRHARSLQTSHPGREGWTLSRPVGGRFRSLSLGRPGVALPAADRRLWMFGAAVLVLLLIGMLTGKSITPKPLSIPSIRPPSATHSSPATPHVQAPAPVAPVATAPPAPSAARLTREKTLGAGGTGYAVQELRYGVHPGDFRIVVDLGAAADSTHGGAPRVTLGFGDATTLYIEFIAVGSASAAPPPTGGVVSAVQLLQPSPLPGRTVYQVTLKHAATLSAYYLSDPVRLVIDLR